MPACILGPDHREALVSWLEKAPVETAGLAAMIDMGALKSDGACFVGLLDDRGNFQAVAGNVGALCVYSPDPADVQALAPLLPEIGYPERIRGRRETIEALLAATGERYPIVKQLPQWYHVLDTPLDLPVPAATDGRFADLDDLEQALALLENMHVVLYPGQPLPEPFSLQLYLIPRVAMQRWYVQEREGKLVFQAEVSALTPRTAQLMNIYTPPALRGQGIARRAVSALSRALAAQSETVSLFVDQDNFTAVRLYESLGYRRLFEGLELVLRPA
jgi:ribosomal protein S18 acetylase RimI-like enzyme